MEITQNLKKLSQLLDGDLYVVGGYVRNFLLGLGNTDIDLTGSKTPEEVKRMLFGEFKIIDEYASFGTLLILCGEEKFEYTTFREDSYLRNAHQPSSVSFTKSIEKDAKRRDFTANAVYYKIDEDKIVDVLGGMEDIKNKILKTCNGGKTFEEDGLRILRMIRISGELDFEIDKETLKMAVANVKRVGGISKERVRDEFDKILVCDYKYGDIDKGKLFRAFEYMRKTGVWKFVLPGFIEGFGLMQNPKYHEKDVYYHSLEVCLESEKELRLAGLLHDVGKPYVFKRDGNFHSHDKEGIEIVKKLLGQSGLKYPNETVNFVARLTKYHMEDFQCDMRLRKLKLFILENNDIIKDLIKLKIADGKGSKTEYCHDNPSAVRMKNVYDEMVKKGVPFSLRDLKINGKEVLEIVGEENSKYIAKVLGKLQILVVVEELENENSKLKDKVLSVLKEVKNVN